MTTAFNIHTDLLVFQCGKSVHDERFMLSKNCKAYVNWQKMHTCSDLQKNW